MVGQLLPFSKPSPTPTPAVQVVESAPSLWRDLVAFGRMVILAIIKVLHKVDWQASIA